MRPLFAIAPLALALALLGPTTQASSDERSVAQAFVDWIVSTAGESRAQEPSGGATQGSSSTFRSVLSAR